MYSDSSSTTESSENSETFPGFQQIQLAHFGSQQNIWAAEADRLKAQHTYKGQLKIAIYVNYGLLTAHVISARHLKSKSGGTCDSYVKVSLMPDEEKRTRCKTEISPDSNNPLFDEKFSFELLDEDIDKRLFISLWNKDGKRKSCEFLGCMSFGIRSISSQAKTISGFYYLLPGDLGKRKHLQVIENKHSRGLMEVGNRNSISSLPPPTTAQLAPPPPVKHDMFWMDTHMITVKRSCRGYGFTISGACPVQVCRVEVGSYAQRIGLRGGDIIQKIDGMNVARTNADTVARIIRHSVKQVVLEIQRQRPMEPVRLDTLDSSPRKPMLTSTPDNYDRNTRMDTENYQSSPWRAQRRHQPYPTGRTPPRSPSLKSVNSSPGRIERNGAVYPSFDTHDYGWIDGSERRYGRMDGSERRYNGLDGSERRYNGLEGSERRYNGLDGSERRYSGIMDYNREKSNFDSEGFRVPSAEGFRVPEMPSHDSGRYRVPPTEGFHREVPDSDYFRAPKPLGLSSEGIHDMVGHGAMVNTGERYSTLPRSMKFRTSNRMKIPTHTSTESLQTKDYGWLDNSNNSKENISDISSIPSHNKLTTAFSTGTLQANKKKVSFKDF